MHFKIFLLMLIFINTAVFSFEKIVSTAPSNTEILIDLGVGNKIVAADKNSKAIDGVPANAEELDFKNTNLEAIMALNPDVVIASTHNFSKGENSFQLLEEAGIKVYYIPTAVTLEDINNSIKAIGKIVSREAEAEELSRSFASEIETIKNNSIKNNKKKVYFEINPEPYIFSFGKETFLNEMIEVTGGENIFKDEKGWISPSRERILEYNPEIIFTNSLLKNADEEIKSRKEWQEIEAVKKGKVYHIDESSLRSSHRVLKALKEIDLVMKIVD